MLIDDALKRLPAEQREVVYLKVFEGMTFQEIADRCEISINTAGSRYRYAIRWQRGSAFSSRWSRRRAIRFAKKKSRS